MELSQWLRSTGWLATVVGVLASGRLLHAEQEEPATTAAPAAESAAPNRSDPGSDAQPASPRPPRYWLGMGCVAVDERRREELKIDAQQGLEIGDVVPDSPAEKAGLKPGEVILQAGGKAVGEVPQLIEAVDASAGEPLTLLVWSEGQTRTLEVTPAERPVRQRRLGFPGRPGHGPSPEGRGRFFERLPGAEEWGQFFGGPEGHRAFMWRFGPGVVLGGEKFPEDLHVKIDKHGNQPAKVEVERGDQKWELTDEHLEKLPHDIRPHVERMLGRSPLLSGHWSEELEENIRRGIEDQAHQGADWARRHADRAREDAERMAHEYGEQAHHEAERAADEFGRRAREWEHALRQRLERMRPDRRPPPGGDQLGGPPGPPPGGPPRPDGPPPGAGPDGHHDPLAGLDQMIDEQIRRRLEKPLADLQHRIDELLKRFPSNSAKPGDAGKRGEEPQSPANDAPDAPGPRI